MGKKLISIILCCSLLLFSGCQDNQAITPGVTKITLWHGTNPPENRDVFKQLVANFNQNNPDIEVEDFYIGQPDAQLPKIFAATVSGCLLYTSPSPRDLSTSRMPSSA